MMHARLLLLAAMASALIEAAAAGVAVSGEGVAVPWLMPYGALPPAIVYDAFGRCLAPLNCPDYEQLRRYLDRYQRNYGQRFAPDKPGFEGPTPRRDVVPTPEAHIQPAYRGASQLRPEFENSGKLLRASPPLTR